MEVRTEIEIAAPPEAVWGLLTDFKRYPEWNPFIVALRGERQLGAELELSQSFPDSNQEERLRAVVVRCDEGRELCWEWHVGMKFLFLGRHFFRVEAQAPSVSRFTHGVDFTGMLLKLKLSRVTETARGLVYMNQALKRRAEAPAKRR